MTLRKPSPDELELIAYNGFNPECVEVVENGRNYVDGDRCFISFQTKAGHRYEIHDGELWVRAS